MDFSIGIKRTNIYNRRRTATSPLISSIPIQERLEDCATDCLVLCDCCNAAITSTKARIEGNGTVTEAIGACSYETIARLPGFNSFTYNLTEILLDNRENEAFSVEQLASWLIDDLKPEIDSKCPINTTLTEDGARQIRIGGLNYCKEEEEEEDDMEE